MDPEKIATDIKESNAAVGTLSHGTRSIVTVLTLALFLPIGGIAVFTIGVGCACGGKGDFLCDSVGPWLGWTLFAGVPLLFFICFKNLKKGGSRVADTLFYIYFSWVIILILLVMKYIH
jgi:hypothetical protein